MTLVWLQSSIYGTLNTVLSGIICSVDFDQMLTYVSVQILIIHVLNCILKVMQSVQKKIVMIESILRPLSRAYT